MESELYSFLALDPGGGALLTIGCPDSNLLSSLTGKFDSAVIADCDAARIKRLRRAFNSPKVDWLQLDVGHFGAFGQRFEVILSFWSQQYLDPAPHWMEVLIGSLKPRGKLAVIERVNRQPLPSQECTDEFLSLKAEYMAAIGRNVNPGFDEEGLFDHMRAGALNYVRKRIFTDPDLLVSSASWKADFDAFIDSIASIEEQAQTSTISQIIGRVGELKKKVKREGMGTPPFMLLTGLKRSRSAIFETTEPQNKELKEALTRVFRVSNENKSEDVYEQMLLHGPASLRNTDVLTVALRGHDVNGIEDGFDADLISSRIIRDYGARALAAERNPGRLAEMASIPLPLACQIVAIFELGRRFFEDTPDQFPNIHGPEDAYYYLRDMGSLKKEHLRGLYLNVQSRLIHDEVISIGTLSRSVVHPREVFAPALEHAANAIILAHNHPSGDLTPSENDIAITKQLAQAGRMMDIELLDHLIIGSGGFVSLKKKRVI